MTTRANVRVFDCFTFFNELDLLEIRLAELSPVVDRFVLVEARKTFQGNPKPLYFRENRERFRPWLDRIEHVAIDFPERIGIRRDQSPAWNREYYQRSQIARGLSEARAGDLVMVSDLDEIPARTRLKRVVESGLCRRQIPGASWIGTRMIEFGNFTTAQKLRRVNFEPQKPWSAVGLGRARLRLRNWERCGVSLSFAVVEDAGWHFTSMGGYEAWKLKVDAYSHEEYKGLLASESDVLAMVGGNDVVGLEKMPFAVRENPSRFSRLLSPLAEVA